MNNRQIGQINWGRIANVILSPYKSKEFQKSPLSLLINKVVKYHEDKGSDD